jgi:outer membrane protein OmpA-like peptidoglycan-associated protein/ribosomal protein L24E
MYFTICRQDGSNFNCDIYYSVFQKNEWGEIRSMGPGVNGPNSWDSQPSVSADGRTLYFASNRSGGLGEIDIWKTTKNADGSWSAPENLGPGINTPGSEKSPFFHSDGQTLYFCSNGQMGFGGHDIFMSKLEEGGNWKTPRNLGYPINSEKDDLGFFVSTDGKTGYFASDKLKGEGGWDIYAFDLYKEARPERVFFFTGELKDENNNTVTDARVEIKNVKTKEITTIDVDSSTGKYVAVMAFNDDHILTVKQPGKAFTSQYLSTADSSLNKPKKVDLEVKEIKVGTPYKINNIQFSTNSYELTLQTINIVQELAVFLSENPGIRIAIHGHTDNVGDPKDNLLLSENRAKKVYGVLVDAGIDPSRLSSKGFGATKPVASNNTESGRALNRRTEFVITGK